MADGDEVTIDVSLRVIGRDGSTLGEVAAQDVRWRFGAGIDTPDLSATVNVLEDDLAADAGLFDDSLLQLLYAVNGGTAAPVGQLMMVLSDDLTVVGGDDESASTVLNVTAKAATLLCNEWRITPAGGVHLRRSPREIIVGWPQPAFDHSGWFDPTRVSPDSFAAPVYHDGTIGVDDVSGTVWDELIADGWTPFADDPDRIYPPYSSVDPADLTAGEEAALIAAEWTLESGMLERPAGAPTSGDAKYQQPADWPDLAALAEFVYLDGEPGDLSLFYLGSFTVDQLRGKALRKILIGSTADEEHQLILFADGYGGIIIDESDQENGFTHWQAWAEAVPAGVTYRLYATMTTVDTPGGDGFDALRFFVATVRGDGQPLQILLMSDAGNDQIKVIRQDKDDPQPGLTIGHAARIVQGWIGDFITPTDASVNTVGRTFTDTEDSAGVEWDPDTSVARTLKVGDSFADFLGSMADVVDAEMVLDDGEVKLALYQQRGTDAHSTVTLKLGGPTRDGSLTSYVAKRRPRTMTRAAFVTDDGMGTRINTTLESTVTARAGWVESTQATSKGEGRALVNRMITEDGRREAFAGSIAAVEGAIPGVDFDWGWLVSGPNRAKVDGTRQVVAWGGTRSGDNEPEFATEMI